MIPGSKNPWIPEADKAAHHSWLIAGEEVINAATLVAQALVPDWREGGGWQVVVVSPRFVTCWLTRGRIQNFLNGSFH